MTSGPVLVAFASEHGSTAGIAEVIATSLREAGLEVECRTSATVASLDPYSAVILGSGVYLARRLSDGQGFLPRHAGELAERPIWLFAAGPIGGGRAEGEEGAAGPGRADGAGSTVSDEEPADPEALDPDCALARVARAFGARGFASFGLCRGAGRLSSPGMRGGADLRRVRGWATAIATELRGTPRAAFAS
jgi:hypothetical protein